jgi:DNA-binding HxlR family transcriptional regulator
LKHDRTIRACSIWRALDVVGDVPVLLLMEQALLGIHSFDEFVARTGLARSVVNGRLRRRIAGPKCRARAAAAFTIC